MQMFIYVQGMPYFRWDLILFYFWLINTNNKICENVSASLSLI